MLRQVEIDAGFTLENLQAALRETEAKIGEIADIGADTPQEGPITVATANNRSRVKANSLCLVLGSEPVPDGKALMVAGTAWVEGAKQVVAVYR